MPDVVLPVLNERLAIPWVLSRMPSGYRPIVVDNDSTDGSGALARSLGATVVVERRRGFGAACWAGLVAATADVVCFMDCDASLDPNELPQIAGPVAERRADLVLGARRDRSAMPWHARAGNTIVARMVRSRTGAQVTDLGPMRAARRDALLTLGIQDRRFGWPLEMVVRAAHAGWRIAEAPVAYHARAGRSKVTGTPLGTVRTVRDFAAVLRQIPAPE